MDLRPARMAVLLGGLSIGCNDSSIVGESDPAFETPSPTPSDEPTPEPSPTATPEPCMFYAVDSDSSLWVIDPETVSATVVGPTGIPGLTDIAITPANGLIGISFSNTYQVNPSTGAATIIDAGAWVAGMNSLDSLPDGRLLVGGGNQMVAVDLGTGAQESWGSLPAGWFSGDIAAVSATRAFAAQGSNANDQLVAFDTAAGSVETVGDLGSPQAYGLDYGCDGELYALLAAYPPRLARVDETTGQATILGTFTGGPATVWGAAGPALP